MLSSWWTDGLKGLKDTAGVVYKGLGEVGGGLYQKGTEAVAGKGKQREAGERAEDGAGEGWDDVSLKRSPK